MKWLRLGAVVAALLALSILAFPAHTLAQAKAETVTIPVEGMT
jgi:hypothetical protein